MKNLYRKMIWKVIFAGFVFFLCVWYIKTGREAFAEVNEGYPTLILDAGHGGEDGGAVSLTGIKESTINLEIVLRLDQTLGLLGEAPLLLREEDASLHDPNAVTLREKKGSDLKNRAAAANMIPSATLVSIHQNSYPESKYRGAQVFYAPTGGSRELAKKVQDALKESLQPNNTREEKEISDNVYLLNHIENRAILIECGFLSNPEEEKILQQHDHQKKLAMILAAALTM